MRRVSKALPLPSLLGLAAALAACDQAAAPAELPSLTGHNAADHLVSTASGESKVTASVDRLECAS